MAARPVATGSKGLRTLVTSGKVRLDAPEPLPHAAGEGHAATMPSMPPVSAEKRGRPSVALVTSVSLPSAPTS